jgi:Uma2 family endonuclease
MSTGIFLNFQPAPIADFQDIRLQMAPAITMTQDQFFDFCQQNPEMRFERTAEGELIIMAPSGGESGIQDLSVSAQLYVWTLKVGKGKATGPSTGFILPNGANRAPDASWIAPEQWSSITAEQRKKFLPVCPFFLIEVRSPSDSLKALQEKMSDYIANGCKLGWLIDPENRQVHVYRPDQPVQVHDNPATASGDPELPGFVLDLEPVWRP